MKNKSFYVLCSLVLLTVFSCKDITQDLSNYDKDESGLGKKQALNLTNEWRNNPYKLNVVYFVPNDLDSIPNFRKRLSKILLDAQEMFASNMDREGFGRKSFGLDLINDSLINIIYIPGNFGKATYPYEGGVAQ